MSKRCLMTAFFAVCNSQAESPGIAVFFHAEIVNVDVNDFSNAEPLFEIRFCRVELCHGFLLLGVCCEYRVDRC